MNSTSASSSGRAAQPAAVAIVYPRAGAVLRVPLRPTRPTAGGGCEQHPERQFIAWFNRMTAAQPGFPRLVKSILLLTGAPLCPSCYRALAAYLGRYQLAGKLRLRSSGAASCGSGSQCRCGQRCGSSRPVRAQAQAFSVRALVLDELLAESEREEEGWWQRAKDLGRAAVLAGTLILPPVGPIKPLRDMVAAAAQAEERRRKTQQTVEDNAPPRGRRGGNLTP